MVSLPKPGQIKKLLKEGVELPLATKNYPSRGQTAVQKLYQTKIGKLFLKRVSRRNHEDCQIDPATGSLAEREFWAYSLAKAIGVKVPPLQLIDKSTTVQIWFDMPDGHLYKKSQGAMEFIAENVYDCALFDWLTGQIDRHDANYLYNYIKREIVLIDSTYGFLKYEGSLPDYLHLFEIGNKKDLLKKIKTPTKMILDKVSEQELQILVPLRNAEETSALIERKKNLRSAHTIQDIIELYRGSKK